MPLTGPVLTSLQNPAVKHARSLYGRKVRHRERAFLVEGPKSIRDGMSAGALPDLLLVQTDASDDVLEIAEQASNIGSRAHLVSPEVLTRVSDTETPQGIIAVFRFPDLDIPHDPTTSPLLLVADAVRDPGNLGTLLRASLGAGVDAIYIAPGTVDPFSPKVVRAGMGAHFRLPIRALNWHQTEEIIDLCPHRYVADASAVTSYDEVEWTSGSCLIVGNESFGLSQAAYELSTGQVSIPLAGGLESLNAGIAGAVILFEAARQRRAQNMQ